MSAGLPRSSTSGCPDQIHDVPMDMPPDDAAKEDTQEIPDKRNPVCTALGASLKERRIAANKSQEVLAFEAGVDRTYISSIERGVANPSVLALANICFCLNITLADLFAPIRLALSPDEGAKRRANRAQPQLKQHKSRLR
jgi:transcriptional regulator with XRE-family HTH domain